MIQTILMAFIIVGYMSRIWLKFPLEMFLKCLSRVVKNFTLSLAST